MTTKFFRAVSVVFLQISLIASCSKGGNDTPQPSPPPPQPPPDPGTIAISIPEPTENKINLAFFSDMKTVDLFSISRIGSNTVANNTALVVTVEKKDALIASYNKSNGTKYEVLPDSLYTTVSTGVSNVFTLNFSSGEVTKNFPVTINGAKWKADRDYAMAFLIDTATGGKISNYKDTVIAFLGLRNKWDGIYTVTGTYADLSDPTWTANYPYEWELRTSGANQCIVWDKVNLNSPGFVYNVPAGATVYSGFGLIVNFDPVTDKIISVVNYYGEPSSTNRRASLDAIGINAYDLTTKTINIKYAMKQSGVVRATFDEKWVYKKTR